MRTPLSNKPEKDAVYVLGHSEEERQRLIEQAGIFGGFTERLFVDAGVGPGMRVLDIGSGVGDVSFLAASLVGPEGMVVGVDRDPLAIGRARERALAMNLENVRFVEGDVRDLTFDEPFDAVVGRWVLQYLADPVEVIRCVGGQVRPGGIVAFQEWNMADPVLSFPDAPLWKRTVDLLVETFRRAGTEMEMGFKLYPAYVEAGLPAPRMRAERPVGGGPGFAGYRYLATTVRSVLPMMEGLGVTTAEEMGVETLEARLREEVVDGGGVISFPTLVGAWARKPHEVSDYVPVPVGVMPPPQLPGPGTINGQMPSRHRNAGRDKTRHTIHRTERRH